MQNMQKLRTHCPRQHAECAHGDTHIAPALPTKHSPTMRTWLSTVGTGSCRLRRRKVIDGCRYVSNRVMRDAFMEGLKHLGSVSIQDWIRGSRPREWGSVYTYRKASKQTGAHTGARATQCKGDTDGEKQWALEIQQGLRDMDQR